MQSKHDKRSRKASKASLRNPATVQQLLAASKGLPRIPGMVLSPIALGPSCVRVVLSYRARVNLIASSGIVVSNIFAGNSVFDPDVSGVGAQPVGFDQWAALYQRYRVLGSTCEVMAATPAATTNGNSLVNMVLTPSNSANPFNTLDAAASHPYAARRVFNGVYGSATGNAPWKVQAMTHTLHGTNPEAVIAEQDLSATTAANPAQIWYWHIVMEPVDRSSTTTVACEVTISYLVDFYERNDQGVSVDVPFRTVRSLETGQRSSSESDEAIENKIRLYRDVLMASRNAGLGRQLSGHDTAMASRRCAPEPAVSYRDPQLSPLG